MKSALGSILSHALFFALLLGVNAALARSPISGDDWIDRWIEFSVRKGDSVEKARTKLRHIFLSVDYDGGGISADDVLIQKQTSAARLRAKQLREWLDQDLNGDGEVTRRELEQYFTRRQLRQPFGYRQDPWRYQNRQILYALRADRNNDGVVGFDEALDWVKRNPNRGWASNSRVSFIIPMSLDKDNNGVISIEEFHSAVDSAIARIDADSNGEFSAGEIAALYRTVAKLRRAVRTDVNARERAEHTRWHKEMCRFPEALCQSN